jgi:hypothetical protein
MTGTPGDFEAEVERLKAARLRRPGGGAHAPDPGIVRLQNEARQALISLEIQKAEQAFRGMIRSTLEYLENHQVPPRHTFSARRGWIIRSSDLSYDHKVTRTREVPNPDYPKGYPNDWAMPMYVRVTETFTDWSVKRREGYVLCDVGAIYPFHVDGDSSYYNLGDPISPRSVPGIDGSEGAAISADWLATWRDRLVNLAARDGADPGGGLSAEPGDGGYCPSQAA